MSVCISRDDPHKRLFLRVAQHLFLFNIGLQVWDGIATYYGVKMGVGEGNPVVRACIEQWGIGWALLSAKGLACGLLVFLHCLSQSSLAVWGLAVTGISYLLCSFLPWSLIFFLG